MSMKVQSMKETEGTHSSWLQIGDGYDTVTVPSGLVGNSDVIWDDLDHGVEFLYGEDSDRVNGDHVYRIQSMAYSAKSISSNTVVDLTCPERNDTDGSLMDVGMWMYVVQSEDEQTTVSLPATKICRYGTQWNVMPECPYTACIDAQCSQCSDWKF